MTLPLLKSIVVVPLLAVTACCDTGPAETPLKLAPLPWKALAVTIPRFALLVVTDIPAAFPVILPANDVAVTIPKLN